MHHTSKLKSLVRHQFKSAKQMLSAVTPNDEQGRTQKRSYAQVESWVLPNSGGLKPEGNTSKAKRGNTEGREVQRRPSPLTVRLTELQRQIIRDKARLAGISVNRFVLASALGSNYRPPADPDLLKALFALNRELTAQGNNLNQIAKQLNAGLITSGVALKQVNALSESMRITHVAIRKALVKDSMRPRS